jgi:hypothetical protein
MFRWWSLGSHQPKSRQRLRSHWVLDCLWESKESCRTKTWAREHSLSQHSQELPETLFGSGMAIASLVGVLLIVLAANARSILVDRSLASPATPKNGVIAVKERAKL